MTDDERLLEQLRRWAATSATTLSPFVGSEPAWALIGSMLSEAIGRRLDESSGATSIAAADADAPLPGKALPSRSELMDFFARFWDVVALTRERRMVDYASLGIDRLKELQDSVCATIVSTYPTTLGRFGREILARDWRAILEELPALAETRAQLERADCGPESYELCLAGLEEVLSSEISGARPAIDLLKLRSLSREQLERMRSRGSQKHQVARRRAED